MRFATLPASLLLILFLTGVLRAGLYFPGEAKLLESKASLWPVPQSFREFQPTIGDLRTVASEKPGNPTIKELYVNRAKDLQSKLATLTPLERVELGACLLRLNKPDQAIEVLRPAVSKDATGFMALANLAVAYQALEIYDRAIDSEEQALSQWPDSPPKGFSKEQWAWYRRVEKYHLLLLKLRQREKLQDARRPATDVDALFFRFEFRGDRRPYRPGPLGPDHWFAEAPADAVAIVKQLLVWLPLDNRLYWLLG
jgi:tetratricopeptide (TPR) repeat protein